jgi:hypothetical protein
MYDHVVQDVFGTGFIFVIADGKTCSAKRDSWLQLSTLVERDGQVDEAVL